MASWVGDSATGLLLLTPLRQQLSHHIPM
jgi:hypothetical protein